MRKMQLGERLRTLRKHRKFTQREAAELININQQSWALMEKNKRKLRGDEAQILAKGLDSNVHWIFTGEGPMTGEQFLTEVKSIRVVNFSALASEDFSWTAIKFNGTFTIPNIDDPENYIATIASGRSMEPIIREGSLIVLQRMKERSEFQDGRFYVIVIQGIPILKKVEMLLSGPDKGYFRISSTNEPIVQIVAPDEIKKWFSVEYVINRIGMRVRSSPIRFIKATGRT